MTTKKVDPKNSDKPAPWRAGLLSIVVQDAEKELFILADQLHNSPLGWGALHIHPRGFKSAGWDNKNLINMTRNVVYDSLEAPQQCYIFFMADNTIVVIAQGVRNKHLPDLAHNLDYLLSANESEEGADFELYDFSVHYDVFLELCKNFLKTVVALEALREESSVTLRVEDLKFTLDKVKKETRKLRYGSQHVLIVEDDPATARLLSRVLDEKCKCTITHNARDAVQEYQKSLPDMVFLDIGLPDTDGLTLLEAMVGSDEEAFVVMLTANSYKSNLHRASELGAKGFIAKPFTPEKVFTYVDKCKLKKMRKG